MARLDTMLRALTQRGASELRFGDGIPPMFRYADEERPVSRTALRQAQILPLLAELAGESADQVMAGVPTRFAYRLDDGTTFECDVRGTNGDFDVRIVPGDGEDPVGQHASPAGDAVASGSSGPGAAATAVTGSSAAATAPDAEAVPAAPVGVVEPSPTAAVAAPPAAAVVTAVPSATPGGGGLAAADALLRELVDRGGSDLHLSANETPMIRVDGDMTRLEGHEPTSPEHNRTMIFDLMPERNRTEYEATGDTDFAHEIDGLARFRVNVFTDRKGVGAVFRVIPSKILTAKDLSLPKPVLDLCHLTKGLVLVTGPTGSGKSTTLAAMLDYINEQRSDHIITIEDPIEFVHPNKSCLVNQREISTHTESFKKALRAALREDPDIVLVGELRDLETIEIAIETAETGHLVFGTLHTTTACSTVDRIIDQFPADRQAQIRTMLSESIKGVVAQTLLKKIGGGRVAALEILIGIPAIANLIRDGKTFQIPSIMQTGKRHGMVLLNDALLDLVKRKVVTPEGAWAKSIDRNGFEGMLRGAGFRVPTGHEA